MQQTFFCGKNTQTPRVLVDVHHRTNLKINQIDFKNGTFKTDERSHLGQVVLIIYNMKVYRWIVKRR